MTIKSRHCQPDTRPVTCHWLRCLAILLPGFAGALAHAEDAFRPADFFHEESKRRLVKRIEFPDVKGDTSKMIHCFSQVGSSGKMDTTGCHALDNEEAVFATAVMKAAKRASMTPARIDGKRRKVYVQFRVEFVAKGEDRTITIYSNPATKENVAAYGVDHIAAQRVIGKEYWQQVCPQRAMYLVIARAFVGEDGRSSHVTLEHINGIRPTIDCQNAIKTAILESRFIPAMDDHVPVPSSFVESFGN